MNKITVMIVRLSFILLGLCYQLVYAQEWTLEACMEYAMEHHGELKISETKAVATTTRVKSAKSALLPEITATAGMDHYWKIPVQVLPGELLGQDPGTFVPVRFGTPWMGDYGVEATFNIADPNTWQGIKLATLRNRMVEDERISLERMLKRHVRMAYHAADLQRQRHALVQSRLERVQEARVLVIQQFEQGFVDRIGLNQSQALVNDLTATAKSAGSDYEMALVDLKFWMGYPLNDTLLLSDVSDLHMEQYPGEPFTVQLSPVNLPEYNRYRTEADLARQEWKAARASLLPRLSVVGGYRRMGFGSSLREIVRDDWFPSGYVGLRLRVPLLSIGNMTHEPRRKRALADVAELELDQYEARETSRFKQELIQLEKASTAMSANRQNMKLARENERLVFQKLEKGIIDMVQFKEVQQETDRSIATYIDSHLAYLTHYVEIQYLLNNP